MIKSIALVVVRNFVEAMTKGVRVAQLPLWGTPRSRLELKPLDRRRMLV